MKRHYIQLEVLYKNIIILLLLSMKKVHSKLQKQIMLVHKLRVMNPVMILQLLIKLQVMIKIVQN